METLNYHITPYGLQFLWVVPLDPVSSVYQQDKITIALFVDDTVKSAGPIETTENLQFRSYHYLG